MSENKYNLTHFFFVYIYLISQNTDFIEGIVVYAGHETKAMLNNSGPRYKRSQLEQQMNYDVIWYVQQAFTLKQKKKNGSTY